MRKQKVDYGTETDHLFEFEELVRYCRLSKSKKRALNKRADVRELPLSEESDMVSVDDQKSDIITRIVHFLSFVWIKIRSCMVSGKLIV